MQLALKDDSYSSTRWSAEAARRYLGANGQLPNLRRYAQEEREGLAPCERKWLHRRLSELGLAFGHERDPRRTTAWLQEMIRLLADLPQDILAHSIDEAVKRSARGFMPSVGEIRAIADPLFQARERQAKRLEAILALGPNGTERRQERPWEAQPPYDPATRCTPHEAAAIRLEFGIDDPTASKARHHIGQPKMPTDADYREMMGEAGFAAWKARERDEQVARDVSAHLAREAAGTLSSDDTSFAVEHAAAIAVERARRVASQATPPMPAEAPAIDPDDPDAWRATIDEEFANIRRSIA